MVWVSRDCRARGWRRPKKCGAAVASHPAVCRPPLGQVSETDKSVSYIGVAHKQSVLQEKAEAITV